MKKEQLNSIKKIDLNNRKMKNPPPSSVLAVAMRMCLGQ